MQHPHFRGQPPVPLQRVFQSHADGRDQDQRQQCREGKATDHGNGKRRTDRSGILRVAHRHRKHGYDRRNGGNQDRADARQPGRHQRPVAAVTAPAEDVGIVDQDNAVVHHHSQQDQEPDHHVRIVQQTVARQQQRQQRTDRRQRDGEQQDERRRKGLEHRSQYHEDQDKRRQQQELEVGKHVFLVEHLDRHARRQVIARHQLVDIRPVAFEEVFRLFDVAREGIEQLDLLVLVHAGDAGTSAAIVDGGDIFEPVQAAGGARYAHFAQVVHRLVPVLVGLFLFFRPVRPVADDDIVGVFPYLERGPGRNLRV